MKNFVRLLTIAMILLLNYTPGDATVRYVRANGTPASAADQATSWATACSDLQAVINASAQSGDEIWVAAGTYYPTQILNSYTSDRDKTFLINKSIKILGGFPATGTPTATNRNWVANPTILSGDFNNNDVVTGRAATLSITGNDENAHHVVIIVNPASDLINQSRLDGFQIKGGYADRSSSTYIGAATINGKYGAGIFIAGGQPTIINCKFSGNKSSYGASGICNYAVFTKIVNCLFEKCESVNNYGVISNIGTNASASIINSTIAGCKGYGMYVSISSPQIINTIVMDNSQGGIRTNQNELDNPIITYSLIQGRDAINNNLNGNTITPAQVFTNAANGDYTLLSTAPTRNAGNNTAYTGIVEVPNDFGEYDIAHYPRIESNTIDMGAYEYQLLNTPVTGVTVSPQTLTLNVGQSSNDLVASIVPANAANQNVTWASSNTSVATVANGVVTAVAPGSATITVSTVDGNHTATCAVTVATPATPPAGTPVIELTTGAAGVSVPLRMMAAAAGTPVWIETATGTYTQATVGTDFPDAATNYTATGTTLKVHGAITRLICSGTYGANINITGINASGNTALQYLWCSDNQLTSLNVSGLTALQRLECYSNQLTSLNLTGLSALQILNCYSNQLTSLNLTGLSALQTLQCSYNQLTSLNVSGLTALQELSCYGNPISNTTAGLDIIYCQLPQRQAGDNAIIYVTNNATVPTFVLATNRANANNKNWSLYNYSGNAAITNTTGTYVCGTVQVSGVTLAPTTLALAVGGKGTLTATIAPSDAANQNVTWTSSNTSVATVASNGIVTAVAPGTTTITVTTAYGGYTATCAVTVTAATVSVTGVTLDNTKLSIVEGKTATLSATVAPADATNKKVTWTSSKPAIATVDNTGKITALAVGNTIIAVITEEGSFTATCEVTVTTAATAVTGVTLDKNTLSIVEGKTANLVATVAPANATNKNVTWTSSKPAIATVDNTGKVTALSVGTTTITVKTENGEKTATCEVTVTKGTNVEDVIENLTFFTISPNPASDRLTLSMSANAPAPKTLSIFNAAGKEMFRLNSPASDLTIDVSNFTSGVYFINIDGVSRKFTIER